MLIINHPSQIKNPVTLPNYFLADLPSTATLSPALLEEACLTLKRNRAQYLVTRSTEQLVRVLVGVAEGWRQADNPFRKLALAEGPGQMGFPRATLEKGLDQLFQQFTPENFDALLRQELGDARALDQFCPSPPSGGVPRHARAVGPEFLVQFTAGNIPNPAVMSVTLGLLTRSAQFVKCASGAAFLPRLFAHSIYEADRKLGACLEVAEWPGGSTELERVLFAHADCVTATGNDETLAAIRTRVPLKTRFVGYGHRVSFSFLAGEALAGFGANEVAGRVADDVIAWNQLGCLSPHVIYVQTGAARSAEWLAERLADELARRETAAPRGELPATLAATIASRRAIYEVRAAHSPETRMWHSRDSTAWTVVYEADPRFQTSCLHRFVYLKPVKDLGEALRSADAVQGQVSTVGLAAPDHQVKELAGQLARWGVTRVCPVGRMQHPPLAWRHDGRPALGDLITWTDLEMR
ncbi:MAG: hypothetical protein KIS67_04815 [Verrucomicrobiae bacterium]|nr:hypothetical protein [Verrucomicrobiae bacterium]